MSVCVHETKSDDARGKGAQTLHMHGTPKGNIQTEIVQSIICANTAFCVDISHLAVGKLIDQKNVSQ